MLRSLQLDDDVAVADFLLTTLAPTPQTLRGSSAAAASEPPHRQLLRVPSGVFVEPLLSQLQQLPLRVQVEAAWADAYAALRQEWTHRSLDRGRRYSLQSLLNIDMRIQTACFCQPKRGLSQ
mmetsp:Transcript_24651/g.37464  ORF Transcript_24651/g.37464 Transcript_24651/m.37464 type:complete len:122 (-) Transcript_24651:6-371(-)